MLYFERSRNVSSNHFLVQWIIPCYYDQSSYYNILTIRMPVWKNDEPDSLQKAKGFLSMPNIKLKIKNSFWFFYTTLYIFSEEPSGNPRLLERFSRLIIFELCLFRTTMFSISGGIFDEKIIKRLGLIIWTTSRFCDSSWNRTWTWRPPKYLKVKIVL